MKKRNMRRKLFTCQWFCQVNQIWNHHRQAKVSPQTPLQNFLLYGGTATYSLMLRNIRQVKPPGPSGGRENVDHQKFLLH